MAGFPLSKKKKILIAAAAVVLVLMVALPFLLNNDRIRTDITLVSRGDVVRTVKAEGIYGLSAEQKTLTAGDRDCRAPGFLLGKPVRKGDILLSSEDGFVLRAPFDGYVTDLTEGRSASVTVSAPDRKQAVVYVSPRWAKALKAGQRLISADGKIGYGTVKDFGSAVVKKDGLTGIPVQIELEEGKDSLNQTLLPGEAFTLYIELERADNVLYVPSDAVCYDPTGNPFVYVVSDSHRAEIVFPEFGIIGDRRAEIRGGLTADERVVLSVPDNIREGIKVLPDYSES